MNETVSHQERDYVISNFQVYFSKYCDRPMAIYGLGKNTKAVLEAFPEYPIVGLMDGEQTGEVVYGKKVISCKEAVERGVKTIVIIARVANVQIIYHRIARFCEEADISVFDINGDRQSLHRNGWIIRQRNRYGKKTELFEKIARCQVISFDIFDTILMRKVLIPTDVFMLVEEKIQDEGIDFPFAKERQRTERELLNEGKYPKLDEIYERLAQCCPLSHIYKEDWKRLELETEKKTIIQRKEMGEILDYARRGGKRVFLTSDTYFPFDQLCLLLSNLGIEIKHEECIISCECGMSKANGLYSILREHFPDQRILHVGDDAETDGRCAIEAGIDDVFLIGNAYDQLEYSSAEDILKFSGIWKDRKLLGEFAVKQFGDPFCFGRNEGKVRIDTEYELGYYFLAPLLGAYIQWMLGKVKEYSLTRLLLTSRDGYVIKKLLDQLKAQNPELEIPGYTYFYTSREICVLAGIQEKEDILYVLEHIPFSGSAESLLQKRFRIEKKDIQKRRAQETDQDYIIRHKEKILEQASIARDGYNAYLSKLEITSNDRCGFIDFVSGGTCQYHLNKFWDRTLIGLYFLRFFDTSKVGMMIDALYQEPNIYAHNTAIEEKYFFLERIMTSLESGVWGFTEEGIPIFTQEERSQEELRSLEKVHQGIIDGFLKQDTVDKELADTLIHLLDRDHAICEFSFAKTTKLTDAFCNRDLEIPGF